jgi:hypothetical protein
MLKLFALLKTRDGMTRDAFVRRYEQGHVPLIERLIPLHSHYRRNFIMPDGVIAPGHVDPGGARPFFDVLTEMKYENQGTLAALVARLGQDGTGEAIAADEADFLDRTQMLMFSVDEHATPAARLQPRPAGQTGAPPVKLIALLKRREDLSRDAFIDYYETRHADLANRILLKDGCSIFAGYTRNYPIPGGRFAMPHVAGDGPRFDHDCISEFWFWTRDDLDRFLALCAEAAIGAALTQDEQQFLDRRAIRVLAIEERVTR